MLLATYQPIQPSADKRNPQYDCFREKLGGEYPVFCFPARSADEFRFRSLLAAPAKPEQLLFGETKDFVRFDAVVWNNILCLDRESNEFKNGFASMFDDVDERFSEYVIPESVLERDLDIDYNLHELIYDSEIGEDEASQIFFAPLQNSAQLMCIKSQAIAKKNQQSTESEVSAGFEQTAFITYLAGPAYNGAMCQPSTMIDCLPFLPDSNNTMSTSQWEKFQELRWKIFDSSKGGTHQEYLEMCDALVSAVGEHRKRILGGVVKRNSLCPCMSGKKYNACHGAKPLNVFPFLSKRKR